MTLPEENRPPHTWRILAGRAEPTFEYERELCYFKLKYWLTSKLDMRSAFLDAGVLYGLYRLHEGMLRYNEATTSFRLLDLFKHPSYKRLFDFTFIRGNLGRIFEIEQGLCVDIRARQSDKLYIEFEIELAMRRLALIVKRRDYRIGEAEAWLEGDKDRKVCGLSVGERCKDYKPNVAYLVAAHFTIPDLLALDDDVFNALGEKLPDNELFGHFCMMVRGVGKHLDPPAADNMLHWLDCEGEELPTFSEPPEEVTAGIRLSRRSAEETRIGKRGRQKPVSLK